MRYLAINCLRFNQPFGIVTNQFHVSVCEKRMDESRPVCAEMQERAGRTTRRPEWVLNRSTTAGENGGLEGIDNDDAC